MKRGLWPVLLLAACRVAPELQPVPVAPALPSNPQARAQFDEAYAALDSTPEQSERRGEAVGRLGMLFQAYGYETAAMACYGNARALDPDEARWPYFAARLYRERGDPRAAEAALRKTLELAPGDVDALTGLARLAVEAGDDAAADELYAEVLALDRHHPEATDRAARSLLEQGRPAAAIELLEEAAAARPRNRYLRFALGRAYAATGDAARARPLLQAAGTLSFDRLVGGREDARMRELNGLARGSIAHERRAQRAVESGRIQVALAEFRLALDLDPTRLDIRHNLASTQLRLGRREQAQEILRENLRRDEAFVPSLVLLGSLLAEAGDAEAAVEVLRRALAADPLAAIAHTGLADVHRRQGRLAEAIEGYGTALELDPRLESGWFGLAASRLQAGLAGPARESLGTALRALPGASRLLGLEARALAATGDGPGCREVLIRLATAELVTPGLRQSLAMAEACAGDWEAAARVQGEVVAALDPDGAAARIARRRLLEYRGRKLPTPAWEADELWSPRPVAGGAS